MTIKRGAIPLILVIGTLLACSLITTPATQSPGMQAPAMNVETAVAGTLAFEAAVQTAAAGQIPPTSEVIQATDQPPAPTVEPTPGAPMISASIDTNCRKGPSTIYEVISYLLVGKTSEVVNKYQNGQWWVIKDPNDPGKRCWVWGQTTTVTGNWNQLLEATVPPTPSLVLLISGSAVFPGSPDPDHYSGPCPTHVNMSWSVTSNLPVKIGYMLLPGSGWTDYYTFSGPATNQWNYESNVTSSGSFWERFEIVSPVSKVAEVTYTVTCTP
jgi:hypothetical protein